EDGAVDEEPCQHGGGAPYFFAGEAGGGEVVTAARGISCVWGSGMGTTCGATFEPGWTCWRASTATPSPAFTPLPTATRPSCSVPRVTLRRTTSSCSLTT